MSFNPKWLIGRTITEVDMRPKRGGGTHGGVSHDPVITLDNGAKLYFHVEETTDMEYGVDITYVKPGRSNGQD